MLIQRVLHWKVLLEYKNDDITIRSQSGDTNFVIAIISLVWKFEEQVMLGDGHGKNRKGKLRYLIYIIKYCCGGNDLSCRSAFRELLK